MRDAKVLQVGTHGLTTPSFSHLQCLEPFSQTIENNNKKVLTSLEENRKAKIKRDSTFLRIDEGRSDCCFCTRSSFLLSNKMQLISGIIEESCVVCTEFFFFWFLKFFR